jgi:hypothetical protein
LFSTEISTLFGDHILKRFEYLERVSAPEEVLTLLSAKHRTFFEAVINDPFPGYEVKVRWVNKLLLNYVMVTRPQGVRYDDDLKVDWNARA